MEMLGDVTSKGSEISITEDLTDPQLMLEEVSKCDLVIGMRLHSLIYAASQYVPPVGISYDPKIDQFLLRLDSEPAGNTDTLMATNSREDCCCSAGSTFTVAKGT